MTPIQVKKVSDEGSTSPFMARIFMGILEFRDQLYLLSTHGAQRNRKQDEFDMRFKPVLEASQATRDAAVEGLNVLKNHVQRIEEGEVVRFRKNQYDILENVDANLSQEVDKLVDQGIVAIKSGLQDMLRELFDLDIGFLFQNDQRFADGTAELRSNGEQELADYLVDIRQTWLSNLQDLRNRHEHHGWSLDPLAYRMTEPNKVRVHLPSVDGVAVDRFLKRTANRVLLFVENMLVFSMSRHIQHPIFVKEIPHHARNPIDPKRFALAPRGLDKSQQWVISFADGNDFV